MSATKCHAESAAATGRRGLHSTVDEIIESVLDAADLDILEDLGEERGARELGPELLQEMTLDVLGRYYARCLRAAALRGAAEK